MATITKPMALDESFNTTESTPRNQADVLAGIEEAIRQGFGQVASAVEYDNTDSGLTADNVQDAIDEVDDTVDGLVDDVTEISSNIESTKIASGNPITLTDAAPINAENLVVELEPQQDLHGYANPWVGGAGKNKCNESLFNYENSASQYCKFTDGKILFKNTAGTSFYPQIDISLKAGTYTLSTQNVSGSDTSHVMITAFVDSITNYVRLGVDYTFTVSSDSTAHVRITTDNTDASGDCSFNVQIESGSQSTDYAPYSNICPITGYTECDVDDVGKNLFDDNGEVTVYNIDTGGTQRAGYKKILLAGTYTISAQNGDSGAYLDAVLYKDGEFTSIGRIVDTTTLHTFTFTIETAKELRIFDAASAQTSIAEQRIKAAKFQVEVGSTATSYEPYHSSNATIQFGQTVYGGKSDFVDGGTNVTYGYDADLGAVVRQWWAEGDGVFRTELLSSKFKGRLYCSMYKGVQKDWPDDGEITVTNSQAYQLLRIKDPTCVGYTAPEFSSHISGCQLAYELAEPTQLSTPPTDLKLLKGTNNITTNGTTINLGYQPDNVIGDVKGEIEKCAVDAEFMQFTDGTDTFTDVNLSLNASLHTVSVVGSKIEQKRFICLEVMDKMGGVLQGILASCIAFTDGAKTPSGTAFRAYIESLQMYVNFRIYGNGGSYTLAYQSETSFSASAFFVRVRLMNNL